MPERDYTDFIPLIPELNFTDFILPNKNIVHFALEKWSQVCAMI